jgi:hypothetical protein
MVQVAPHGFSTSASGLSVEKLADKRSVRLLAQVRWRSPSKNANQLSCRLSPWTDLRTVALVHTARGREGWLARRK